MLIPTSQPTQEKNLANVITPDLQPTHVDLVPGDSADKHQTSVVDLMLLARATCLVTSPSGFSHHAWLAGGGKACQREFYNCSTLDGGPGGGARRRGA